MELNNILNSFGIYNILEKEELSSGLINQTYSVVSEDKKEYILQRINSEVFPKPEWIMHNIHEVNKCLREINSYQVSEIIQSDKGQNLVKDAHGNSWRLMKKIAGADSINTTSEGWVAKEAGRIIGLFHTLTKSCNINRLHTILPGFHDLSIRMDQFRQSLGKATVKKKSEAQDCIEKVELLFPEFIETKISELPLRVTHNDTKLNNVLFDLSTRKALSIIDLDTLMPGYLMHDYGDAIRTLCNSLSEDDSDLNKISFQFNLFESFSEGYFSQTKTFLEPSEWDVFGRSIQLMPYIMAIRFLTDFLSGDRYYKVDYSNHNLVRCQNQLAYLLKIKAKSNKIENTIQSFRNLSA